MRAWDGPQGLVAAKVMARHNRDAEAEAIGELDPSSDDTVLAIGFGPGVGVELLASRVRRVVGVDPSAVMVREARRRVRAAGNVELHRAAADALPLTDASVDAVIAVNSLQLWSPLDASIAEVVRVLRPGGRLVTFTHDWSLARRGCGSADAWLGHVADVGATHGLGDARWWHADAEGGRSIAFVARVASRRRVMPP